MIVPLMAAAVLYLTLFLLPRERAIGELREQVTTKQQYVIRSAGLPRTLQSARQELVSDVRYSMKFLRWAPVLYVSALTGSGMETLLPTALEISEQRNTRIPTSRLMSVFEKEHRLRHGDRPPRRAGLKFITQVSTAPPTFVFFARGSEKPHFSERRRIENRIRELMQELSQPVDCMEWPRQIDASVRKIHLKIWRGGEFRIVEFRWKELLKVEGHPAAQKRLYTKIGIGLSKFQTGGRNDGPRY